MTETWVVRNGDNQYLDSLSYLRGQATWTWNRAHAHRFTDEAKAAEVACRFDRARVEVYTR